MKKLYQLEVRGKEREWLFTVEAKPEHVEDWRADGLMIDEIVNSVPDWVVALGLAGLWYWMQDLTGWGFSR